MWIMKVLIINVFFKLIVVFEIFWFVFMLLLNILFLLREFNVRLIVMIIKWFELIKILYYIIIVFNYVWGVLEKVGIYMFFFDIVECDYDMI